jgi:peptidase E
MCLTWYEAEAYAAWRGGRLPTEAEWEYAARAPESKVYPWGDTFDRDRANVLNSVSPQAGRQLPDGTSWVGANDMAGNAMEWVSDWLGVDYYATSPATDPTGPATGEVKVEKGGWWGSNEFVARSAYRHYEDPTDLRRQAHRLPGRLAVSRPTIVAMGGGGFSMEPENPLLDDYVLDLARSSAVGRGHASASLRRRAGTRPATSPPFYAAFARRAEASHLALFIRTVDDVESFLRDQDVIYVGGGNTENMLAIWRVHGVDRILGRAWEEGVVLTGLSAGSLCWFETGSTDSFGGLAPLSRGLGFLAGSHSPHYDGEESRRPHYLGAGRRWHAAGGIRRR